MFSSLVRAEFKSGISLNQDEIDFKVIEYIYADNLSFHLSPSFNYNNISDSRIKAGGRYYFSYDNSFYSELTSSLQYNAKSPKISTNIGYVKQLTNISSLSLSAGYSFAQDDDLTGTQINIGLNLSWSAISNRLNEWQQERKRQQLKENYNWEDEIITAILAGTIKPEMSKKQVEYSWGQPHRKYSSQNYQIWEYQIQNLNNSHSYLNHILYFQAGQLKFWEQHQAN